ncbi:SMAD/FHA domain-containing protein [Usnea florida]
MSDRGSDFGSRRDRRRRYSSDSEDGRRRSDRPERKRSFDRPRFRDKNRNGLRDDSRSDHRRKRYRSRSPRTDRARQQRHHSPRSRSPSRRHPRSSPHNRPSSTRNHSASPSPPPKRRRHHSQDTRRPSNPRRASPLPTTRSTAPLPSQQAAFTNNTEPPPAQPEKQKPNYNPTGALAAETNTVANTSIVLKYNEPPESRLPPPSAPWRLYVFKGPDLLETLPLHERSCWLFGRERAVVDFPVEHPSASKQHAVLQFRWSEKRDEWGGKVGGVRLYVIDLESANGTAVNGGRVPERRFVEVRSGDVITFGESTREYVLMLPPKDIPKG